MRIRIKGDGHNFCLCFPTRLIFSKTVLRLANHFGRRYAGEAMATIPPGALDALFAEFRRIKKAHGSWELVDVQSSDGDSVQIIL